VVLVQQIAFLLFAAPFARLGIMPQNNKNDTIAAQTTPSGRGGVGVIRVSGPKVKEIAEQLLGVIPKPR